MAGRVRPFGDGPLGQNPPEHVVDRPGDRRHCGDSKSLEDLGAARIVDAGYHVRNLVSLAGDARAEDVGVRSEEHTSPGANRWHWGKPKTMEARGAGRIVNAAYHVRNLVSPAGDARAEDVGV